jgi:hypothetical protein
LPFTDLDKIFWSRAALGAVGGTLSELLTGCKVIVSSSIAGAVGTCEGGLVPDYSTGILIGLFLFLGSYYLIKLTIGKKFPKADQGKIYMTGLGSYALLYVFFWVFLYTLGITYLNL